MGDALRKTMIYLGLAEPVSGPGYRWSGNRSFRYQVCDRCGARVNPPEESQHDAWHTRLGW